MFKKLALVSGLFAALSFASAASATDWNQKAENDKSPVITLGGIFNAQVQNSKGSTVGIQGAGASASSSVTNFGNTPIVPGQTTSNQAKNFKSPVITVGLIANAQVQGSQGSAVFIGSTGAAAIHSITSYHQ